MAEKLVAISIIQTITVIAEESRDDNANRYSNKGGIQMTTNTTGISTSHTTTNLTSMCFFWGGGGEVRPPSTPS